MKSYSQYTKEENKKVQDNIDKMKPIERLDFFNRYDRILERYSKNIFGTLGNLFLWFGVGLILFSMLLISLETEMGILMGLAMFKVSLKLMIIGVFSIYLFIFEIIIRLLLRKRELNELKRKYNL